MKKDLLIGKFDLSRNRIELLLHLLFLRVINGDIHIIFFKILSFANCVPLLYNFFGLMYYYTTVQLLSTVFTTIYHFLIYCLDLNFPGRQNKN